jgi:hypothetical protein
LKRPIRLKRNACEEVAECVLKRETENDAKDCGSGEQRPEIDAGKQERERDQKENRKRDDREDVADQRRRVDSFESKSKTEEKKVQCADEKITQDPDQD